MQQISIAKRTCVLIFSLHLFAAVKRMMHSIYSFYISLSQAHNKQRDTILLDFVRKLKSHFYSFYALRHSTIFYSNEFGFYELFVFLLLITSVLCFVSFDDSKHSRAHDINGMETTR